MIILKEVKHYPGTNSVEATWVDRTPLPDIEVPATDEVLDEEGGVITPALAAHTLTDQFAEVTIKCHSYADVQMAMLHADLGGDAAQYADLIALVESNIKPPPVATMQEQLASFETILDSHLDEAAQLHRYNDRFAFALRAGYAGPYQAEAIAFATWMDACNLQAYAALQEIVTGKRPMPTEAEFIAALPTFGYPAGA